MVAAASRAGPVGPRSDRRAGVDLAGLRGQLAPALAATRTDLRLVLPAAAHGLAFARAARGPVAAAAARGVRTRLLAEEATAAAGAGRVVAAAAAGIDVRVVPRVAFCLLVADGSVAFAVLAPPEAMVLRDPDAVAVAGAFFDDRWGSGAPPAPRPAGPVAEPDALDRAVLTALASGSKDEVAARQLGLSVRSLRRRVAVLLDRLGAGSRFEAGVRAAELGWVGDRGGGG